MRLIPIAIALAAVVAAAPARANYAPMAETIYVDADDSKAEKEEALYDAGSDLLDDHHWRQAAETFDAVAKMHGPHADGALYWHAYAYNKMGNRADALAKLNELRKSYPKSKWVEDAKALEVEIRQSLGETVRPGREEDDDVKLIALRGLMESDPDRALPILDEMIHSSKSSKLKDRALFVVAQSNNKKARELLIRAAENGADRQVQERAIKYIALFGGDINRKVLADVYVSSNDVTVKKGIIRSYMLCGDRVRLLTIAKSEPSVQLRGEAITQLGLLGVRTELADLYTSEQAIEIRKKILSAMFLGGNGEKLAEIARSENNVELKRTAIRNLGLLGGSRTGNLLIGFYDSDGNPEIRKEVVNALFIQGNAAALVGLARREKNPELRRDIVQKLALMHSKEATDYLIETLKE